MSATETPVAVVDPTRDSQWDELLARFPGATVFHGAAWARVLKESYGYRPMFLAAGNGGDAVLPLMEVQSWLTGKRAVSLPFTDECNPLASDEVSARLVIEGATKLGRERMWKSVEMRGAKAPFLQAEATGASFLGHVLDLRIGERALFERVASPVRRAIRKAEREETGVRIEHTLLALKTYYRLHC